MAQTQNYEVYYDIKVNATEGTEQVTAFANAVEKLSKGRISFAPVVTNINEMMQAVEKTFRGKNGKKKDFNFDLEIRTGETEKRLEGVKNLLTEIKELTQGIKLTINPGEKIDGRALRNQTNKLVGKKKLDEQQAEAKRNAASAVKSVMGATLIEFACTMLPVKPSAKIIATEKKPARNLPNLPVKRARM